LSESAASTACWLCGAATSSDPVLGELGYQRCPECDFVFSPQRGSDELRELYDDDYFEQYGFDDSYQQDLADRRFEAGKRLEYIDRWQGAGRGELLEIGSASGVFLASAREHGYSVTGVEPAENLAQEAIKNFGVTVYSGMIEDLQLAEESFDVVCGWHVLEHIAEPKNVVTELARLLKPGGLICFEVPNYESTIAQKEGVAWPQLFPEHHVSQFGPHTISRLVAACGLAVVDIETDALVSYVPAAKLLRSPLMLAAQGRFFARTRVSPFRPDPARHELLRVAARKPA
jgi:2-polyprenyl-3-methyl-5-hydroxy-6-metoxy-1,4-benzoquinol methylase